MHARWKLLALVAVIVGALFALTGAALSTTPLSGAIFTTDSACTGTNVNIFGSKGEVSLDGGPAHPGAAGLPDGSYYVQVTGPDGAVLGTSIGSGNETPVVVSGGEFATCYQLASILIKASDNTPGYDTTSNAGGEYKVWVSTDSTFTGSASKTDNFKVRESGVEGPPVATLHVTKFYDANANGVKDGSESDINGWMVNIHDGINFDRFTPVTMIVDPDNYVVTEYMPIQTNWYSTTTNPVNLTLAENDDKTVTFGNLCLGAGGGLTLGFWSNKNGQALVGSDDTAMLVALNLRNASGAAFDPNSYAALRTWLLNATATNMAYMLSAQLAATELDVLNGKVNGSSLIYAPGTTSANSLGFATVNAVMAEANAELGANGLTPSGSAYRSHQEALKNALDRANNNLNFVQATPCTFTFATQ
jgi:hypothetical protein